VPGRPQPGLHRSRVGMARSRMLDVPRDEPGRTDRRSTLRQFERPGIPEGHQGSATGRTICSHEPRSWSRLKERWPTPGKCLISSACSVFDLGFERFHHHPRGARLGEGSSFLPGWTRSLHHPPPGGLGDLRSWRSPVRHLPKHQIARHTGQNDHPLHRGRQCGGFAMFSNPPSKRAPA